MKRMVTAGLTENSLQVAVIISAHNIFRVVLIGSVVKCGEVWLWINLIDPFRNVIVLGTKGFLGVFDNQKSKREG